MIERPLVAACLLVLAAPSAEADWRDLVPGAWGGRAAFGYEQRDKGDVGRGDPLLGTGAPRFWFAEPQDVTGDFHVWGEWKIRTVGQSTKFEFSYERRQWVDSEILGHNVYGIRLRHAPSDRSRLELGAEYIPQIYKQHRADKDALPGEPRFRPEAFQETDLELGYRRTWGADLYATAFVTYTVRDETKWFNERDLKRPGLGLNVDLPLGDRTRLEPEYEFRVNASRNKPDLGSDLSYREHVAQLRFRTLSDAALGPWDLAARTRWRFRSYTTDNPEDPRRYKRHEQIYFHSVRLRRPAGNAAPFVSWEITGRWVDVPAGVETADEDGEIDRSFLQLGVEWEF